MLSENTHKLVWVSITVATVATAGIGAMTLFPQATSIGHQAIQKNIDSFTGNSTDKEENTLFTWTYNQSAMTAKVTGFKSGKGSSNVEIPKWRIVNGQKYRVTAIGQSFSIQNNNTVKINSVSLPDGLTTIENFAFNDQDLTSLNIPESVNTIEHHAFAKNSIKSITLSTNLTNLGEYAFNHNKIETIDLPNNLTILPTGVLADNQLSHITIPKNVTDIQQDALGGNNLTEITIPNTVKTIGRQAFGSNQLTTLNLPDSIQSIGYGGFDNNPLKTVRISKNTQLGNFVFDTKSPKPTITQY